MLYVAEYLEANVDWLVDRLDEILSPVDAEDQAENNLDRIGEYVIFDTPGQVELWTNHDSFKKVIEQLTKLDYRVRRSSCSSS